MPLGNPIQAPGPGAMPYTPTRRYGGGAGTVYTNPWGAKTAVPKGAPMPQGPGKYGFGEDPFTGYSPQTKVASDDLANPNSLRGNLLKQNIQAYRNQLMQAQKQ